MTQSPHSLSALMPSPKPNRGAWPYIAGGLALALVLAAVAAYLLWPKQPAPAAAPAPTTAQAVAPAAAGLDAKTVEVCKNLVTADETDLAAMKDLGSQAAESPDTTIHLAGLLLRDSSELATLAKGTDSEVTTSLQALSNAIHLRTACITGGYEHAS